MTTAIYPGSFDPLTYGHTNIVERAVRIFDRVIVAVAVNAQKKPLFTLDERVALIRQTFRDEPRVEVDCFEGLLVSYAARRGAQVILRGLRAVSDFDYEFQMVHMNHRLAPTIETIFMMTGEEHFYVSSRLVKEVASLGGDIAGLVPPVVLDAMRARLERRSDPGDHSSPSSSSNTGGSPS